MRQFPFLCVLVTLALLAPPAAAQKHPPAPKTSAAARPAAPVATADSPDDSAPGDGSDEHRGLPPGLRPGPQEVDLGEGLTLAVPSGQALFEAAQAKKMLLEGGTKNVDGVLGLVVPMTDDSKWLTVIRFIADGYIKDSEALDAKAIFDAIKEGTEELNEDRKTRGIPPLFVDKWFEEPHYERARHHMVWGLQGHTSEEGALINYNTHVLGRRGYVSLNLISEPASFVHDRAEAAPLLDQISFRAGDRYEDFKEGTDKVAEYGLAGLVLGGVGLGAAKLVKIGLLAKFGKVIVAALIAGKKAVVAVVLGLVAMVKRFFGKKEER